MNWLKKALDHMAQAEQDSNPAWAAARATMAQTYITMWEKGVRDDAQ